MKVDRRLIQAIVVIGVASVVWLALTIALITSTLEPAQRALVSDQLAPRLALIGLTWVFGLVAIGATLRWLFRRYATAPARLVPAAMPLVDCESPGKSEGAVPSTTASYGTSTVAPDSSA